jgi:DHA1 family tetracycline resistance protein-like MFS transporter
VALGIIVVDLIFIYLVLPESGEVQPTFIPASKLNPLRYFSLLKGNKLVLGLVGVLFVMAIAGSGVHDIMVLYLKYKFGWGPSQLGVLMSVLGVCSIFSQGVLLRVRKLKVLA